MSGWTLEYRYISNVDAATGSHTGLDPGWFSIDVESTGEVHGAYRPAPIPSLRKQAAGYMMRVSPARAGTLRDLFVRAGLESTPDRRIFDMNEGETVSVALRVADQKPLARSFAANQLPDALRPFLAEMTALMLELQSHAQPDD